MLSTSPFYSTASQLNYYKHRNNVHENHLLMSGCYKVIENNTFKNNTSPEPKTQQSSVSKSVSKFALLKATGLRTDDVHLINSKQPEYGLVNPIYLQAREQKKNAINGAHVLLAGVCIVYAASLPSNRNV